MAGNSDDENEWGWVPSPGSPREAKYDPDLLAYLRWMAAQTPEERRAAAAADDGVRRFRPSPEVQSEEEAPPMSTISSVGDTEGVEIRSRKKASKGGRGSCQEAKLKRPRKDDGDAGSSEPAKGERRKQHLRAPRVRRKD